MLATCFSMMFPPPVYCFSYAWPNYESTYFLNTVTNDTASRLWGKKTNKKQKKKQSLVYFYLLGQMHSLEQYLRYTDFRCWQSEMFASSNFVISINKSTCFIICKGKHLTLFMVENENHMYNLNTTMFYISFLFDTLPLFACLFWLEATYMLVSHSLMKCSLTEQLVLLSTMQPKTKKLMATVANMFQFILIVL